MSGEKNAPVDRDVASQRRAAAAAPKPAEVADDDPHKIEKIAKAGRTDFDPNDENEG